MKIKLNGMAGKNHSWSYVTNAILKCMVKKGHEVFIKSTNNLEHFPKELKPHLVKGYHGPFKNGKADFVDEYGEIISVTPEDKLVHIEDNNGPYDLEWAYTIPLQYPRRFSQDSRCRAAIYNYETSVLPSGWHHYIKAIDFLLPSSQYSYDIFAKNGIPEDKMIVVPHGVDTTLFNQNITPYPLKTKKKVKLLHNARPHARKLHNRVIKGYLDAFTGDDDICLVLKTKFLEPDPNKIFEVDVRKILEQEFKGRDNPPEIEVVTSYVPDIGALYTACDAVISMSSCEGFNLTLLESLACGCAVIAPRHGGQLEFLNDNNALLINTEETYAPKEHQYWIASEKAVMGDPDIEHYKELLHHFYKNVEYEKARIKQASEETVKKFSWENATQMILGLPIPEVSKRLHKRKKILYIIPYNMVGGGEVWVKNTIKQLDRNIYEPHVALVSGTNDIFFSELREMGVIIEDLSKDEKRDRSLKCLIEAGNYSVIHFYNSFGVYKILQEAWNGGFRCRIVETVHSDFSWSDSMVKVSKREEHVLAQIAISNQMGRKLLKNGNKNVMVLPQVIDWKRFAPKRDKKILKNINTDFVVGFVGRLSPEKNVPLIIKCAEQLPDVSFVIVGDGPQKKPLEQMSEHLNNIHFLGSKQNVEEYYNSFDALILPSFVEGLPLVILEAMSCGTPVIASDVGAISEVVFDKITGSLIWNERDPSLFIKEIKKYKEKGLDKQYSNNCISMAKAFEDKNRSFNINEAYNLLFGG